MHPVLGNIIVIAFGIAGGFIMIRFANRPFLNMYKDLKYKQEKHNDEIASLHRHLNNLADHLNERHNNLLKWTCEEFEKMRKQISCLENFHCVDRDIFNEKLVELEKTLKENRPTRKKK